MARDRRRWRRPRGCRLRPPQREPPNSSGDCGSLLRRSEEHHADDPQVIDRRNGGVQHPDSRQDHKPRPARWARAGRDLKELPKTANLPQKPASGGMPTRLNMHSATVAASRGRRTPADQNSPGQVVQDGDRSVFAIQSRQRGDGAQRGNRINHQVEEQAADSIPSGRRPAGRRGTTARPISMYPAWAIEE